MSTSPHTPLSIHRVEVKNIYDWFDQSWELVRSQFLFFLTTMGLGFVINVGIHFIPLIGGVLGSFLGVYFLAGALLIVQDTQQKRPTHPSQFLVFFDSKKDFNSLLPLAALSTLTTLCNLTLQKLVNADSSALLFFVIQLTFVIPNVLLYWISLPLMALKQYSWQQTLEYYIPMLKINGLALLVFSMALGALFILAALPMLTGYIVVIPLFPVLLYKSFHAFFGEEKVQSTELQ